MKVFNKKAKANTNKDDVISAMKRNQEMIEKYIIDSDSREDIDYDANFDSISKKNISDRDNAYTKLLNHFVNVTKYRNIIKEIHKWIYFWTIMVLITIFGISVCSMIMKFDVSDINNVNSLVAIITSVVSFASVIISIPLIITKYLFSSKEDKRIATIILHTQQHDLDNKKILEQYNDIKETVQEESLQQLANVVTQQTVQMEAQEVKNNDYVI